MTRAVKILLLMTLISFSVLATSCPPRVKIIPAQAEKGQEIDGTVVHPTDNRHIRHETVVGMALTPEDAENAAESPTRAENQEFPCAEERREVAPRESNLIFNWINVLLVLCGVMAYVISSR